MENNQNTGDDQVRQPRDLQGLLNMSIQVYEPPPPRDPNATAAEGERSELPPVDPEKIDWLRKVVDSMSVDVPEELRKNLRRLCADNATEDDQVEALDAILDFVDDVNYANDFFKLGGFGILNSLVRQSPRSKVRAKCAEVVAELVQNFDWGQAEAKKHGGLETLVAAFREDADDNVKINAFSALSRLIRDSEEEIRLFSLVYPDVVTAALDPKGPARLKTKASFFLTHIMQKVPEAAEHYSECVANLVSAFGEDSTSNTFVLGALRSLWTSSASEKYPDFQNEVQKRLEVIKGNDQFLEECHQADLFLKKCQS